jgi:cytochrome P450
MPDSTTPKGKEEREAERAAIVAWLEKLIENRKRVDDSKGHYWATFIVRQIRLGAHLNQKDQG